jgi:hypothetical protein
MIQKKKEQSKSHATLTNLVLQFRAACFYQDTQHRLRIQFTIDS